MSKIITLNIDYDNEYQIIGISSHLKAYKLIYFLNTVLSYKFKRTQDFSGMMERENISYSTYIFRDQDSRIEYCIISNHHPEQKLIPALKQIDYFLIIKYLQENRTIAELLHKIKRIPRILTAYKIDNETFKDIGLLYTDIEMHMLENKE